MRAWYTRHCVQRTHGPQALAKRGTFTHLARQRAMQGHYTSGQGCHAGAWNLSRIAHTANREGGRKASPTVRQEHARGVRTDKRQGRVRGGGSWKGAAPERQPDNQTTREPENQRNRESER